MFSSAKIDFKSRIYCPVCASTQSRTLWASNFDDPAVIRFMDLFHYSGDWRPMLAGAEFALVRCTECGMAWHREIIAPEWLPVVYGEWADAAQAARFESAHTLRVSNRFGVGIQLAKMVLRIIELLDPKRGTPRLLDFGCGDGTLLKMADLYGMQANGIDISASRTEWAGSSSIRVMPTLEDFDATVGEPLDAVVLSQVLEHVSDPLGLLRAIHTRITPGGVLFVGVPDCSGITVPQTFDEFHKVQPIEHMNAFTPSSLHDICKRAGFQPVRRPSAFVTTRAVGVLRSAANWFWQPITTDQFFRRL